MKLIWKEIQANNNYKPKNPFLTMFAPIPGQPATCQTNLFTFLK